MSPCLLILEDIDTIVTPSSRSYFFNEVDGLENNDGIFMVASTNHLDQLDPGLSNRPSRFDRKYLFPLPSEEERTMYCEYWREKLKTKPTIKFPKRLSPAIAGITEDFSFAYLKEAFVATLLVIASHRTDEGVPENGEDEGGDLDDYELWREMKEQVKLLREEMSAKAAKKAKASARRGAWDSDDSDDDSDVRSVRSYGGPSKAHPAILRSSSTDENDYKNNGRLARGRARGRGRHDIGPDTFGMAMPRGHRADTGARYTQFISDAGEVIERGDMWDGVQML